MLIFSFLAYITAGGCGAINCYIDKDIDGLMPRTAKRAIPSGKIKPKTVFNLGTILIIIGLSLTYLLYGLTTWMMITLGAVFYLLIYSIILKRRTKWSVIIGALAGSFAALAGWTATRTPIGILPIFVGVLDFLWTPGHLWSLSMAKVDEYKVANVPMLSVKSGLKRTSQFIFLFNSATVIFSFIFILTGLPGLVFTIIATIFGARLVYISYRLMKEPSPEKGMEVFIASIPYLAVLMIALVLDTFLPLTFLIKNFI